MEERSSTPPLGNILMFVAVLALVLVYQFWLMPKFFPPPKAAPAVQEQKDDKGGEKQIAEKPADGKKRWNEDDKPSDYPAERTAERPKAESPDKGGQVAAAAPRTNRGNGSRWGRLTPITRTPTACLSRSAAKGHRWPASN